MRAVLLTGTAIKCPDSREDGWKQTDHKVSASGKPIKFD
jgi:hypothetical protein